MLLKYFYDEKLAQASYMVGCQASKEAVVIDPARNINPYIEEAKKHGMNIVGALETHIHADFVSGARELSENLQATLYISDEGNQDWKYKNIDHLSNCLLKDSDEFQIGNITFKAIHTPGHTPESISFILTDGGGKANSPMGIFTGDFVFVGDVGRPDLLEKTMGAKGATETGAHDMFESLKKFKNLPDFMQIWPGHGAGSACGKSLGAIPSSTVGYEKRFNWALKHTNRDAFVKDLLEGQPVPPNYFAMMKKVNKTGATLIKKLPRIKEITNVRELEEKIKAGAQIIDTRASSHFAKEHIEGTINLPFNASFVKWAGWLLDYKRPLYLLAKTKELEDIKNTLHSIGFDQIEAYMNVDRAIEETSACESYKNILPREAKDMLQSGTAHILDVRNLKEWEEEHIEGAQLITLSKVSDHVNEILSKRPIIVYCASGMRSAIAVSILQANGIKDIFNLTGGYISWKKENLILKLK
jgi:hydroxyacylglutathione hydrolase